MSSSIFGLGIYDLVGSSDFRSRRDAEGKTTASRSFTLLSTSKELPQIQQKTAKGNPITAICPDLGPFWDFLQIEEVEFEDQPGGMCVAWITFTGYVELPEFTLEREITYSARGVLTERPMILHPNYITEVKEGASGDEHAAIVALYNGTAYVEDRAASDPKVIDIASDNVIIDAITDVNAKAWYDIIFVDGRRTYEAPSIEWTKAAANAGGLKDSDIAAFGKKDDPPGNPPEPEGVTGWWKMVDLGDERSSNASSYTLTWRFYEGEADTHVDDY